jgi:hypothetical protein
MSTPHKFAPLHPNRQQFPNNSSMPVRRLPAILPDFLSEMLWYRSTAKRLRTKEGASPFNQPKSRPHSYTLTVRNEHPSITLALTLGP